MINKSTYFSKQNQIKQYVTRKKTKKFEYSLILFFFEINIKTNIPRPRMHKTPTNI